MDIFANMLDRKLKSGIYIKNNLINKWQEDQSKIWKHHDVYPFLSIFTKKSKTNHFTLKPVPPK